MEPLSNPKSRAEEILAKKAKIAQYKRQREIRSEQFASTRQSLGGETLTSSPGRTSEQRRSELDSYVASLIDRKRESTSSPSRSRPSSYYGLESSATARTAHRQHVEPASRPEMVAAATQTSEAGLSAEPLSQVTLQPSSPVQRIDTKPEVISYSKGIQTDPAPDVGVNGGNDLDEESTLRRRRRSTKQFNDEEIRSSLRREIEDEVRATLNGTPFSVTAQQRFPFRQLNNDELSAVTTSDDFKSFVNRSTTVIERALDEEYDLLADYTRAMEVDMVERDRNLNIHALRDLTQLYSAAHSRRRMVTDLHFSPHFSELLLSSYTKDASNPYSPNGLVLLWNVHSPSRPEYVFNTSSDVLAARFSPFHPNLVIGGCYSGQVCIWDTRSSSRNGQPERRTPPTGPDVKRGHTHPIFSLAVVGTPNAHNIITTDTDGVVCSWSMDMLAQAQEHLRLAVPITPTNRHEDIAPKSMSFPTSDPTSFVVGSEEGTIYPCHRYDRAGAKAGIDAKISYKGHTAPLMSTHYHPGRGPVDLGDLLLSSSSDWTVRLWHTKPTATSTATTTIPTIATTSYQANLLSATSALNQTSMAASQLNQNQIKPLLTIRHSSPTTSALWHPARPSVFATTDEGGNLSIFDLLYDVEIPVASAQPSKTKFLSAGPGSIAPFKGLNKLAWEERTGKHVAVGGLDGVVSVFEVGSGLRGEPEVEEWTDMSGLIASLKEADE